MKTTIITIAVAALLSVSNVFGSNKLYKNTIGSEESGMVTSTACKSSGDGYLTPYSQNVFYYNPDKSLKERVSFKWDAGSSKWIAIGKHSYEYGIDGRLSNITYVQWDNSTNSWKGDAQYAMFIYGQEDGNLLTTYSTTNK